MRRRFVVPMASPVVVPPLVTVFSLRVVRFVNDGRRRRNRLTLGDVHRRGGGHRHAGRQNGEQRDGFNFQLNSPSGVIFHPSPTKRERTAWEAISYRIVRRASFQPFRALGPGTRKVAFTGKKVDDLQPPCTADRMRTENARLGIEAQ